MRIKDNSLASNEPPTLVADCNGTIIFANNRALDHLNPVKTGDSISKYVDLDYIKKFSMLDKRMDVIVPKCGPFEKVVVKAIGNGVSKTVELSFVHTEKDTGVDLLEERRFFATYSEVIGAEVMERIKLADFANKLIDCLHADLRFAYRKFHVEDSTGDNLLYTNFSHLSALAVSAIILLNEIECRNPIDIEIGERMGEFVLKISVKKPTFAEANGTYEFSELFPNVAMRLIYIASICDNDGIRYNFSVKPDRIVTSFVISNMINETGKFSYSSFGYDQSAYISYLINMLMPNETREEAQEE